jgi:acetamidase/formamidase
VTYEARNMPGFTTEIPMHPFMGTIGTAPAVGECHHALTPWWNGGNMDCVETKAGATVYLPVNVPGAMWSTGDCHLAQGDGETCGVAVESRSWVTIDVSLIKGKKVNTPRFENDEYLMSAGSMRPLDSAYKIAYEDLLNWLVEDYGFDKWDAFQLMTQVVTVRIGNVVDTNPTVVAKFPKKYLPK